MRPGKWSCPAAMARGAVYVSDVSAGQMEGVGCASGIRANPSFWAASWRGR